MRRNLLAVASAIAVLGLLVGGMAFAADDSSGSASFGRWGQGSGLRARNGAETAPAPQITTGETIELRSVSGPETFVDVAPRGESVGDHFIFREELFRLATSRRVGTLFASCMLHFRTIACEGTFVIFGRGKLAAASAVYDEPVFTVAVTGGTGDFQNVRGQAVIRDARTTLHLTP